MAKFLIKAAYTAEGAKGLQSAGGASRRDAVAKMAEGLGEASRASISRSARPMLTSCWTSPTTRAPRRPRSQSTLRGQPRQKLSCC